MLSQLGALVDSFLPRELRIEGGTLQPASLHMEILLCLRRRRPQGECCSWWSGGSFVAAADPLTHTWGNGGVCEDAQSAERGGSSCPRAA